MHKLRLWWNELRASLWLVPSLVVAGAAGLAFALVELDTRVSRELLAEYPRLFGAGAEGSRGMLEAIASSMITVAGVTFSITVVALSLASSQYTPRILRNFTSDRANQTVLGVFVGVFTYCLIVLRTIRGGDEGRFVPSLSVVFAVVLALVAIGFLIYFIHHIASSIQASSLIASAAAETVEAVDHLFPQELGGRAEDEGAEEPDGAPAGGRWLEVPSRSTGYVQSVDAEALLRLAAELRTVLRMECGVGDFVVEGEPLVALAAGGGADAVGADAEAPGDATVGRVNDIYAVSRFRTVEQDATFGVRQIVDIALKALSPGVNDTTTAVTCVDYLSAICARVAGRRVPDALRHHEGRLRVIARGATFESLLDEAFDQIRESAEGNTAVILRVLGALESVARRARSARRLRHIAAHAARLQALADRSVKSSHDRARIEAASAGLALLLARLGAKSGGVTNRGAAV
jgi:uncharacterized membrane protein